MLRSLYLLQGESCNGEYGTIVHQSLHLTGLGAMSFCKTQVTQADLEAAAKDGRDTFYNQWRSSAGKPGVIEFRTGLWGYKTWTIEEIRINGFDSVLRPHESLDEHGLVVCHKKFDDTYEYFHLGEGADDDEG